MTKESCGCRRGRALPQLQPAVARSRQYQLARGRILGHALKMSLLAALQTTCKRTVVPAEDTQFVAVVEQDFLAVGRSAQMGDVSGTSRQRVDEGSPAVTELPNLEGVVACCGYHMAVRSHAEGSHRALVGNLRILLMEPVQVAPLVEVPNADPAIFAAGRAESPVSAAHQAQDGAIMGTGPDDCWFDRAAQRAVPEPNAAVASRCEHAKAPPLRSVSSTPDCGDLVGHKGDREDFSRVRQLVLTDRLRPAPKANRILTRGRHDATIRRNRQIVNRPRVAHQGRDRLVAQGGLELGSHADLQQAPGQGGCAGSSTRSRL